MIGQWKSGGDGANTTKALMADNAYIHGGYLPGDSSFFNELKRGWKHLLDLMFIF